MALIKKHNKALGIFIVGVLVLLVVVMVRTGKFNISNGDGGWLFGTGPVTGGGAGGGKTVGGKTDGGKTVGGKTDGELDSIVKEDDSEEKITIWKNSLISAFHAGVNATSEKSQSAQGSNIEFIEPDLKAKEDIYEKELQVAKQDFKLALSDLKECLGEPAKSLANEIKIDPRKIQLNDLLTYLKSGFGEADYYVDKKVSWILRKKSGSSEKIEMEVFQQGDSSFKTQVKKYLQDQRLGWVEISFSDDDKKEILSGGINHWLREGELISKNRSGIYYFKNKFTFDFAEEDGSLAAVEFTHGERYFICQNIQHRESCACR